MQIHIPRLNSTTRGLLFLISGIILLLYVTNIITVGLSTLIFLASLALIFYGLLELDAFNKCALFLKRKK